MDRATKLTKPLSAPRAEGALAEAYLYAKKSVLNSPHWAEVLDVQREPTEISESDFLRELAWVILSAGIAEIVVRKKFPEISKCFCNWKSARQISENAEECIEKALSHFRHQGKIRAIATAAVMLASSEPFEKLRERILSDPIRLLQTFPYIGPVTAFHIAKNIGIKVAKPDRHLFRLAQSNGFESVEEFCRTIAHFLGEDIRRVDSVLWRFATLHHDYLYRFSRCNTGSDPAMGKPLAVGRP